MSQESGEQNRFGDQEATKDAKKPTYQDLLQETEAIVASLHTLADVSSPKDTLRVLTEMCDRSARIAFQPDSEPATREDLEKAAAILETVGRANDKIESLVLAEFDRFIPNLTIDQMRREDILAEKVNALTITPEEFERLKWLQLIVGEINSLRLPVRLPSRLENIKKKLIV